MFLGPEQQTPTFQNLSFMLKELPCARHLSKLLNSNNLLTHHKKKSHKVVTITIPISQKRKLRLEKLNDS